MKRVQIYALLCVLVVTGAARAETTQTTETSSRTYIGLSVGSTKTTYLEDELGGIIAERGMDGKDVGGKIFLGIKTDSPYFDARFSLVSLGDFIIQWYESTGSVSSSFDGSLKVSGLYANGLLKLPFASNKGALFAKLGLGYASAKQEVRGEVMSGGTTTYSSHVSETDTGLSLVAGLGASYDLGKHFGLQIEAERYFISTEDPENSKENSSMNIDFVSAGVYYRF